MARQGRASTARQVAASVVRQVVHDGAYSHIALDAALEQAPHLSRRDRALATEVTYGTLTWLRPIDALLGKLVTRPIDKVDPPVLAILRTAIYQLRYLDRIPDRAVVHSAVEEVASLPGAKKARPFVNGVLRAALRMRDEAGWETPPADDPVMELVRSYALPRWMARFFIHRYGPDDALNLARALTERPPLTLRLAPGRALADAAASAPTAHLAPAAAIADGLDEQVRAMIERGEVTVQDEAAQLVGLLADPKPGERILDACAGVGGKTTHLAELGASPEHLFAVEPRRSKVELMERSFDRLGRPRPTIFVGDLEDFAQSGCEPFDCIVLDVPCSGLGVIRRHPEIRWTRRASDVAVLAELQGRLLDVALRLLKPGGRLIYAACTFTEEEGTGQIARLLQSRDDLGVERQGHPAVSWTRLRQVDNGFELRPHDANTDGFYFTRIRLRPSQVAPETP